MLSPPKTLAAATLSAALLASPATARVLFFDDFNGENGGQAAQDYASFENFDLQGPADIVTAGQLGFGDGAFVALGTSGLQSAALTSKPSFQFAAGETVTLSVEAAGSQGAGPDELFMIFDFIGSGHITDIAATGGFGAIDSGEITTIGINTPPGRIDPQNGFSTYTFSFRALEGGAFTFSLSGGPASGAPDGPRTIFASHDPGMLIDNVRLTASDLPAGGAVPEPATWALMLSGFGLAGAGLRRRRIAGAKA